MEIEQPGQKRAGHRVGERARAWVLPRLDDGELSSDSLRGKKTLLFFWASW